MHQRWVDSSHLGYTSSIALLKSVGPILLAPCANTSLKKSIVERECSGLQVVISYHEQMLSRKEASYKPHPYGYIAIEIFIAIYLKYTHGVIFAPYLVVVRLLARETATLSNYADQ